MLSVNAAGVLIDILPNLTNILVAIGETADGEYVVLEDENGKQGAISYNLIKYFERNKMIFLEDYNVVFTKHLFKLDRSSNIWKVIV